MGAHDGMSERVLRLFPVFLGIAAALIFSAVTAVLPGGRGNAAGGAASISSGDSGGIGDGLGDNGGLEDGSHTGGDFDGSGGGSGNVAPQPGTGDSGPAGGGADTGVPGADAYLSSPEPFLWEVQGTGTSLRIGGMKVLSGGTLSGGDFTFNLYDGTDNFSGVEDFMASVTNDAQGKFLFDVSFSEPGDYLYRIREEDSGRPGIRYDSSHFDILITVRSAEGGLDVYPYLMNSQKLVFTNYVVQQQDTPAGAGVSGVPSGLGASGAAGVQGGAAPAGGNPGDGDGSGGESAVLGGAHADAGGISGSPAGGTDISGGDGPQDGQGGSVDGTVADLPQASSIMDMAEERTTPEALLGFCGALAVAVGILVYVYRDKVAGRLRKMGYID